MTFNSNSEHSLPEWIEDEIREVAANYKRGNLEAEHAWPADRLTFDRMTDLRRLSNQLGRPVNQLIREAVTLYVRID